MKSTNCCRWHMLRVLLSLHNIKHHLISLNETLFVEFSHFNIIHYTSIIGYVGIPPPMLFAWHLFQGSVNTYQRGAITLAQSSYILLYTSTTTPSLILMQQHKQQTHRSHLCLLINDT